MKTLTATLGLALLGLTLNAQTVPLKITPPANTAGITNYVVYFSTNVMTAQNFHQTSLTNFSVGTNLSFTCTEPIAANWYFMATAVAGNVESAPCPVLPVSVPQAPVNLMPVAVAYAFGPLLPVGVQWTNLWMKILVQPPVPGQ